MSDLLPQDIQVEILLRLPVKSILTFKCVCKIWHKLICSPKFVKNHLNRSIETNNFRFMAKCYNSSSRFAGSAIPVLYSMNYASISSEPLPCNIAAVLMEYPIQDHSNLYHVEIWGSCNGLICLTVLGLSKREEDSICIWNPSTREYKKLPECDYSISLDYLYPKYGFAYDCVNNDYKLVQVADLKKSSGSQLRVYTLGSNSWNNIQVIPYVFSGCGGNFGGYIFQGALHWLGLSIETRTKFIVCFDISTEIIVYVPLPEEVAMSQLGDGEIKQDLGVWEECFSVFSVTCSKSLDIWVMKDYGVQESWIKQFTITLNAIEEGILRLVPVWAFQNGDILVNSINYCSCASYIYNLKKGIFREVSISIEGNLNQGIFRGEEVCLSGDQKVSRSVTYVESLVSLSSGTYVGKKQIPNSNDGVGLLGPLNSNDVDLLVNGIMCPPPTSVNSAVDNVASLLPCLDVELLNKVFEQHIQTIKNIPPKCKLQFSRVLKYALDKVRANPADISVWIQLLLLPVCTLHLYIPKSNSEERSGNRKALQIRSINQSIVQWYEPDGCIQLVQQLLHDYPQRNNRQSRKNNNQEALNLSVCRKKIRNGLFNAAIKVLTSDGVATDEEDTLKILIDKHPYAPPPILPTVPIVSSSVISSNEIILGRIRSFPKGTSCGRDGLRVQHLLDSLNGPAAVLADDLLTSIKGVVNLWFDGRCPPQLGEFVASAPLTPLLKPDGGIRPIAVGTVWRRLVSKVAAQAVGKDMSMYLRDFQFGVGIPCGGEAILHSVNRILHQKGNSSSTTMLLVDFSNAFNMVSRSAMLQEVRTHCPSISKWVEFCYSRPPRLYYNSTTLSSSQGVQQGDPLGPLLFSLTLHTLVKRIAEECNLDLQAWYLDDGTIIGDTLMVSKALNIIKNEGSKLGLHLNIAKTEIFWPTMDIRCLDSDVFSAQISRPTKGVKLLGGPVSLDHEFCSNLIKLRVLKTNYLMDSVRKLDDPQCELLLLRSCAGVSRLYFSMRTTRPDFVIDAQVIFDAHLSLHLRHIITNDGPGMGLLQYRMSSLPLRFGGLGIYFMADAMNYCYLASCIQTQPLQISILRNAQIQGPNLNLQHAMDLFSSTCGPDVNFELTAPHPMKTLAVSYFDVVMKEMPVKFSMSTRDCALWECNKSNHAQDYLKAIPIEGLNQRVGAQQFGAVLQYRLGIPLFVEGSVCVFCKSDMDCFGDHALHCAHEVGIKFRHDVVRDTYANMCFRAGVPAKKEVELGFLADDGSALRPADILVLNWDNGRDKCLDVTGVSPFTGGGVHTFRPGLALQRAIKRKHKKYSEKCLAHGYNFGTLAFTTFGELCNETVEFLKRLNNHLSRFDVNAKKCNYFFHRLGIVIQKGVGAQLVARLPSSYL